MKSEGFVSYTPRTWHPDTRSPPVEKMRGLYSTGICPSKLQSMKSEGFASVTARWHLQPTPPRWPGFPPRAVTLPALHPPPPAPGPTVKRAARQARQAGCPRPPYKHHAREALPMHALVFRAHSHIQPCTMRHPTPFSQLRRFQQPFFQRARSLPPLQMPAPSLASKKQRHARNTRVFAVARAPRRRAKRVVIVPAASKHGAAAASAGCGSNSVLKHVRVACSAFRSVCCNDWTGKTSVHFLLGVVRCR
jgi:hypothetical protein